jgi:hypothetical protein
MRGQECEERQQGGSHEPFCNCQTLHALSSAERRALVGLHKGAPSPRGARSFLYKATVNCVFRKI